MQWHRWDHFSGMAHLAQAVGTGGSHLACHPVRLELLIIAGFCVVRVCACSKAFHRHAPGAWQHPVPL